ncbi:MAG: tRNA (N6-isopentenyl adenosine(37)-C2)-methylthiotransferase MiaB [Bacteroidota bacterium]|nr:tRNA (N6-isopentenyl adenosine(37)-C2)-methylthiotransferase MiaB [Bacteroidota bacterium]
MTGKKVYIETYGCQMNVADSEVVLSILKKDGYEIIEDISSADVILVNTCSVRENAEERIIGRLGEFKRHKMNNPDVVVGVLGCMAEKFRTKLFTDEKFNFKNYSITDIVVGPDEYRKLPDLVSNAWHGEKGIAVKLSRVENYDDITPLRKSGISAWISVMRGCDKFCSFCVVPFTRGRERSRPLQNIIDEVETLARTGYKEITLLGQNVNSYSDGNFDFADLIQKTARVDRNIRILFTTSHPQDMSDKLIDIIATEPNIAKYIHLPVQSGSDRILNLMNRNHDSDYYFKLIAKIKNFIPQVSLSTDIITGYPSETETDHQLTIELLKEVKFDGAFMFAYSPRENTKAFSVPDDVSYEEKIRRLNEIIELQNKISLANNTELIGQKVKVLIEGYSKKTKDELKGRTDRNKKVVFPKNGHDIGEYTEVLIARANSATLFGSPPDEHLRNGHERAGPPA